MNDCQELGTSELCADLSADLSNKQPQLEVPLRRGKSKLLTENGVKVLAAERDELRRMRTCRAGD